ncbi:MAG TPA: HNH endonuclease signature motif containing protein [Nitrososphaera sp.]|nr:HNH endonuclease signature motif containing protein [Nitrososphaera sp.]
MSFFGPPGGDGPAFDAKKYGTLTMAIRQTVLERARSRCQKCSVKFGPSVEPQFEHINGSKKDNRPKNLRALCPNCYKAVEERENKKKGVFGGLRRAFEKVPVDFKK